jgi:hypothetical protein
MKMPEPIAIHEGADLLWIAGKQPTDENRDGFLYDKQALIDLLETAAAELQTGGGSLVPKWRIEQIIRKLKETL